MPRKRVESVQLRLSVPRATAERIERVATALGSTVPDVLRYFVAMQLVRTEKEVQRLIEDEDPRDVIEAARAAGVGVM